MNRNVDLTSRKANQLLVVQPDPSQPNIIVSAQFCATGFRPCPLPLLQWASEEHKWHFWEWYFITIESLMKEVGKVKEGREKTGQERRPASAFPNDCSKCTFTPFITATSSQAHRVGNDRFQLPLACICGLHVGWLRGHSQHVGIYVRMFVQVAKPFQAERLNSVSWCQVY